VPSYQASTKATSDFRTSRTLPFSLAAIGGIAAAAWSISQKEVLPSGAKGGVSSSHWVIVGIAGVVIVIALWGLFLAYRSQQADEHILGELYDSETQTRALRYADEESFSGMRRRLQDSGRDPREYRRTHGSFDRQEFREALWESALEHSYSILRRRRLGVGESLLFSKVDLKAACRDSTDLAITRFIDMGLVDVILLQGHERFLPTFDPEE